MLLCEIKLCAHFTTRKCGLKAYCRSIVNCDWKLVLLSSLSKMKVKVQYTYVCCLLKIEIINLCFSLFFFFFNQTRKWRPRGSGRWVSRLAPLIPATVHPQGEAPAMSVVSVCRCQSGSRWQCWCAWLTSLCREVGTSFRHMICEIPRPRPILSFIFNYSAIARPTPFLHSKPNAHSFIYMQFQFQCQLFYLSAIHTHARMRAYTHTHTHSPIVTPYATCVIVSAYYVTYLHLTHLSFIHKLYNVAVVGMDKVVRAHE
jgi:hypothetical protein